MQCKFIFIIFLFILISNSLAQTDSLTLNEKNEKKGKKETGEIEKIYEKFKNFEYSDVILLTEEILKKQPDITKDKLMEILRMRAVSYYSTGDVNSSFTAFMDILKANPEYRFDPIITSPKIINFFEEIRSNFNKTISEQNTNLNTRNKNNPDLIKLTQHYNNQKKAIFRSLIFPGWGHFSIKKNKKGLLYSSANIGLIISSIYFINDSRQKEKKYLQETDKSIIDKRYDSFNSAYKNRNMILAAYSAFWVIAQIDLIKFSLPASNNQKYIAKINPYFSHNQYLYSGVSLQISF